MQTQGWQPVTVIRWEDKDQESGLPQGVSPPAEVFPSGQWPQSPGVDALLYRPFSSEHGDRARDRIPEPVGWLGASHWICQIVEHCLQDYQPELPVGFAPSSCPEARNVKFDLITTPEQLEQFCAQTTGHEFLGFDTEFVSENLYRPLLCLVQAVTRDRTVLIDAMAVPRLDPFWELVCHGVRNVVVHAAREEFLFCYRACGKRPARLFDLQIAAGFLGHDFPAAYSTLVGELAGKQLDKGETRTDWRIRPLTQRQMEYAVQDVEHLPALYRNLLKRLESSGRLGWYEAEIAAWQDQMVESETQPSWMKLSGLNRLGRRSLAIARQLALWRERVAGEVNRSPRRILPDDLLIEIAKRSEADPARVKGIRGLQNRVSAKHLPEISEEIGIAMDLPDSQLPARIRSAPSVNLGIVGQFLQTGLNLICVREKIAPGLVANASDVRDLAGRMMGLIEDQETVRLEEGWRREIVGESFRDLLSGKMALRIAGVNREQPLELVPWRDGQGT